MTIYIWALVLLAGLAWFLSGAHVDKEGYSVYDKELRELVEEIMHGFDFDVRTCETKLMIGRGVEAEVLALAGGRVDTPCADIMTKLPYEDIIKFAHPAAEAHTLTRNGKCLKIVMQKIVEKECYQSKVPVTALVQKVRSAFECTPEGRMLGEQTPTPHPL